MSAAEAIAWFAFGSIISTVGVNLLVIGYKEKIPWLTILASALLSAPILALVVLIIACFVA